MESLTQTVEVRAFSSDDQMNEAMQERVNAIYADVFSREPVAGAIHAYESAQQEVSRIKSAQTGLTNRARELFDRLKDAAAVVETGLIEASATGSAMPGLKEALRGLTAIEAEHRAVLRANSRVLEHLLPLAEIAELHRTSDQFTVKAGAIREAAMERIRKTAQLMADAAEHEGGIVFDPVRTLSGALQLQAAEFDRQAQNYRRWAIEREEQHARLVKELESINSLRPS